MEALIFPHLNGSIFDIKKNFHCTDLVCSGVCQILPKVCIEAQNLSKFHQNALMQEID